MCSLTALISAVGSVGKKTLGGRTPHAEFRSRVWVKSADAHGKKETQTVRSERSEVIPGPDDKTLEIISSVATFRFLAVPRAWEKKNARSALFPLFSCLRSSALSFRPATSALLVYCESRSVGFHRVTWSQTVIPRIFLSDACLILFLAWRTKHLYANRRLPFFARMPNKWNVASKSTPLPTGPPVIQVSV